DTKYVKEQETKTRPVRPIIYGAPAQQLPQILSKPTSVAAARSVPPCASAPPVKGYLRPQTNTRNPFLHISTKKMPVQRGMPVF
ncbi:MAG: hypothetical protein MRY67_14390, partial [Rhodovulum sp.]|nr:hypothetical protein [Rhodovulum sp.]